jgi:hypothetical protein
MPSLRMVLLEVMHVVWAGLDTRRSQHFQQIRHPAQPMILGQTLESTT